VVPEGYQGGEEFVDDCRVDVLYLFPYRVRDSIGTRSGGGGPFGAGELNLFLGEGGAGGVLFQAASAR